MEQEKNYFTSRLMNMLSFKSGIAKKFAVYIVIFIVVLIFIMLFSIHDQVKNRTLVFDKRISDTTKILGESLEDPVNGGDMVFLEKLVNSLISNQGDIIYIIILSEDQRVFISSIDSYNGKQYDELGDKFSALAAHDTRLNLRKEQDSFIRMKIFQDKKDINQRIIELKKNNPELRYTGTLKDVEKQKQEKQLKDRILKDALNQLYDELNRLESNSPLNQKAIDNINNQIQEKTVQKSKNEEQLISLTYLYGLIEIQKRKDEILDRMSKDNMIYEVSAPIISSGSKSYGIIRIGFTPKYFRNEINSMYINSFVVGMIFIIIGLLISFQLAKTITKPLNELSKGAEILGSGNLYHRINIKTGDELEILADGFNHMAEKLNESYSSLEQKVQERTREYLDATKELQRAYKKLQQTQAQLVHNEKMTSLGQLVAGVAHELNNPIGFITSNVQPLEDAVNIILELVELLESLSVSDEDKQKVNAYKEENDFEFLLEDLQDLIEDVKEGAKRAHKIVLDLRNFSRLDEAEFKEVDLHQGIDSTLNLLSKHYKHKVKVHKQYGDIPFVSCYASQLNQVWMNILVNAAQAIKHEDGQVWIITESDGTNVTVKIKDNGCGIEKEVLDKLFDPFFTTKPVGEGTGLGLSITHSIIEKHQGEITIDSIVGEGTTFVIKLPISRESDTDQGPNE
ncbi:MAG: ATP-binding protein [Vampirovibrionia bacterium]